MVDQLTISSCHYLSHTSSDNLSTIIGEEVEKDGWRRYETGR